MVLLAPNAVKYVTTVHGRSLWYQSKACMRCHVSDK